MSYVQRDAANSKSQVPNPKQRIRSKVPKWRTKPGDLGDRTFEFAQSVRAFVKQLIRTAITIETLSGFERLNFTWDLGIGIWNFRFKLDVFTTNSAVQGL